MALTFADGIRLVSQAAAVADRERWQYGDMPKALPILQDTSPICRNPLNHAQVITAEEAMRLVQRLKA